MVEYSALVAIREIKKAIKEIEGDERYHYPDALVEINAPLALIQVGFKIKMQTLEWVLGLLNASKNQPTQE